MVKLSNNFDSTEFLVSNDYPDLAAQMLLDTEEIKRLRLLCQSILQPLRDQFGPLKILSGLRSPELNAKVSGSPTSDHLSAIAADVTHKTTSAVSLWLTLTKTPGFSYRQCILYPDNNFFHVSINIPGKTYKRQVLKKTKDGYI